MPSYSPIFPIALHTVQSFSNNASWDSVDVSSDGRFGLAGRSLDSTFTNPN